jgi:hypothetical protein
MRDSLTGRAAGGWTGARGPLMSVRARMANRLPRRRRRSNGPIATGGCVGGAAAVSGIVATRSTSAFRGGWSLVAVSSTAAALAATGSRAPEALGAESFAAFFTSVEISVEIGPRSRSMIARQSQGKTNSPPAVNPIGMQLPPDEFACEELPWAELPGEELAGEGFACAGLSICAKCWFRKIISSAWAPQIAATVNNNTKPVFFIVDLQDWRVGRGDTVAQHDAHHNYDARVSFSGRNPEPARSGCFL